MKVLLALCCWLALAAQAETFSARVIAVMDGDTILVLRGGQKIKVRLANIDAPEKDQAFGKQARDALLEMVGRSQVRIDSQAVDQYGRMIGVVSVDGRNVNEEQVRRGMAWEYSHYHADKTYLRLQGDAGQARRGLWAHPNPQPPWQWRRLHPSVYRPVPHPIRSSRAVPQVLYDMECGKKRHCSEMVSCDEARFYLIRCAAKTLDGDRDALPCESLCRGK